MKDPLLYKQGLVGTRACMSVCLSVGVRHLGRGRIPASYRMCKSSFWGSIGSGVSGLYQRVEWGCTLRRLYTQVPGTGETAGIWDPATGYTSIIIT